jgi:hypothetical protein
LILLLSKYFTEIVNLFVVASLSLTGFETLSGISGYSYLNASTGFLVAALQLCQLTVNSAIPGATNPERANIHQLNSVL